MPLIEDTIVGININLELRSDVMTQRVIREALKSDSTMREAAHECVEESIGEVLEAALGYISSSRYVAAEVSGANAKSDYDKVEVHNTLISTVVVFAPATFNFDLEFAGSADDHDIEVAYREIKQVLAELFESKGFRVRRCS